MAHMLGKRTVAKRRISGACGKRNRLMLEGKIARGRVKKKKMGNWSINAGEGLILINGISILI
jgi:hypothetical protein